MREKKLSFVDCRVYDNPMGMMERLEFSDLKTSLLLGCCVIIPPLKSFLSFASLMRLLGL
jgi:hypothetical protein